MNAYCSVLLYTKYSLPQPLWLPSSLTLDLAMWLASANRMWATMTTYQFKAWALKSLKCFHLPQPLLREEHIPGSFCLSRMGSVIEWDTWSRPSALLLQVAHEHKPHCTKVRGSRKSHPHCLENCREEDTMEGNEDWVGGGLRKTQLTCRPVSKK